LSSCNCCLLWIRFSLLVGLFCLCLCHYANFRCYLLKLISYFSWICFSSGKNTRFNAATHTLSPSLPATSQACFDRVREWGQQHQALPHFPFLF
jgi:hypothetical protein